MAGIKEIISRRQEMLLFSRESDEPSLMSNTPESVDRAKGDVIRLSRTVRGESKPTMTLALLRLMSFCRRADLISNCKHRLEPEQLLTYRGNALKNICDIALIWILRIDPARVVVDIA